MADDKQEVRPATDSVKTPRMDGIRSMLLPAAVTATPSFVGLRDMFLNPRKPPETPKYDGVRKLYNGPPQFATPNLVGVKEVFRQKEQRECIPFVYASDSADRKVQLL